MKSTRKIVLVLFLSLAMASCHLAQEYTPFDLEEAEWVMHEIHPIIGPGDGGEIWKNNTTNDTTIDGLNYKNVTQTTLCQWWPDGNGERVYATVDHNPRLIGGIRQEGKTVFFYRYFDNEEIVLYDFDIEVGDTSWYSPTNYLIIESKDMTNGRVRYSVLNSTAYAFPHSPSYLTEGVGSSYGLFGVYRTNFIQLMCHGSPDQIPNGNCSVCEGYVSTTEPQNTDDFKFYPNPATEMVHIESIKTAKEIKIFNASGEQVIRLSEVTSTIDVSHLHRGLYTYSIQFDDGSYAFGKFTKL